MDSAQEEKGACYSPLVENRRISGDLSSLTGLSLPPLSFLGFYLYPSEPL
jgi:hypothetical protein